jgi:hypothetical protein
VRDGVRDMARVSIVVKVRVRAPILLLKTFDSLKHKGENAKDDAVLVSTCPVSSPARS